MFLFMYVWYENSDTILMCMQAAFCFLHIYRSLDNNFLTALPYGGDFQNMEMAGSFSADGNYITSIQQGTFYNFSCTSV